MTSNSIPSTFCVCLETFKAGLCLPFSPGILFLLPESSIKLHFQPPLAHISRISQFPPVNLFQMLRDCMAGVVMIVLTSLVLFSVLAFVTLSVTMKAEKNILRRRGYLCPCSHRAQTRLPMMTFIDITLSLACHRHT